MTEKSSRAAAAVEKPRYDDAVAAGETDAGEGVRIRKVSSSGAVSEPVKAPVMVVVSPDRNPDPDDVERPMRRESPDWLSHQLEDPNFSSPAFFEWARTGGGKMIRFSRCYRACSLIVDMFGADNQAMRAEVEVKRARIIAHNEKAKADLADIERVYQGKLKNAKSKEAREVADQWKRASMSYRRREGLLPMGYLPILTGRPVPDFKAAKAGEVLDLPPAPAREDVPYGGVGVFTRYA